MPQSEPAAQRKPRARKPAIAAPQSRTRGDGAMARDHSAQALATLVTIMSNADAPATARVSAANALLDRAWGKPRQDLELSSPGDSIAAIQRARLRVHAQGASRCASEGAQTRDE